MKRIHKYEEANDMLDEAVELLIRSVGLLGDDTPMVKTSGDRAVAAMLDFSATCHGALLFGPNNTKMIERFKEIALG